MLVSTISTATGVGPPGVGPSGDRGSSDEEEDELFVNTNRPPPPDCEPSDSSGSDIQED